MDVIDLENPEGESEDDNPALAQFRKETDAISEAIDRIHENVEIIESRYKMSMNMDLDPEDREYASGEISRLLERTEQTSGAIRKRLRRIAVENTEFSREHKEKTGELRVRVNTHQLMTRRFMEAMQVFEETQDLHRKSVKSALERQLRRINPEATDDDIQDAIRRGKLQNVVNDSRTFDMMSTEEQTKLRDELAHLQCRNDDIKKLEASIVELHQLFMDMQILVETQGDLLNNIEYNIQETKGKTEAGLQELVEARAHQKSAGKKKACIVALIVVILLVVSVPILVKYIPIWFPETKEVIDNVTSAVGGNTTAPTPSPSASTPETSTREGQAMYWEPNIDTEVTSALLQSADVG